MSWLREPDTEPIPGYRLVEPLGTGGFGEVWKCIAPGGIHKAIKFVYGNLDAADGDAVKAQQEYSALEKVKAVRHPFVLSMDRIEVVDGEVVIVMELADKSLYDLQLEHQAAGRPGIPRDLLLGFLSDAAEGLDHLIEKYNLLHLDVKPKNLFLIADRVKVADFGLVKHLERHSQSGVLVGITPVYAAPETFSNKISKHSDQYSLAIVYTDLLTGQRVFNGKNIRQLAVQHLTAAPDLSLIPEEDRPAVARALSKNPDDRFESCSAFIRALMGGQAVTGTSTRSFYDIPGFRKASVAEFDFSELGTTRSIGPTDVTPRPGGRPHSLPDPMSLSCVTASRVEPAALRPALMIGVGTFGRRALQYLRGRLLDRLGDLRHVPCIRFLYLDPDTDAPKKASHAAADVALSDDQILTVPLQPVTNYRRKHLDHLTEWLPLEKLYSIPRSLAVDGSRALGRLAFSDHYLRITTRLRHELETVSRPELLARASTTTGLSARDKTPVVYIFISASGGTGGMLLDLGHAVKKALERLHLASAPVVSFVFVGAPNDAVTPAAELANVYATVAELNHFADEEIGFTAGYAGPDGPRVDARSLPFTSTYLMSIAERSPVAFRDCLAHMAGYVTHDLTTPFGTLLERVRTSPPGHGRVPFRGFGTFGVWYPRGLVLRSAARRLCSRVVQSWLACDMTTIPEQAHTLVEQILADPRLVPEAVMRTIAAESSNSPLGQPEEFVSRWIRNITDVSLTPGPGKQNPQQSAAATWEQCRELVGFEPTSDADSAFRRAKFGKALDAGVKRSVDKWKTDLSTATKPVEDMPGVGLAGVQAVCSLLVDACKVTQAELEIRAVALAAERGAAHAAVEAALADWPQPGSGFSLFGNRTAKAGRAFQDALSAFFAIRVREDLTAAAVRFYSRLGEKFATRLKDLFVYRARLNDLSHRIDDTPGGSLWCGDSTTTRETDQAGTNTVRMTNTVRVVLPFAGDQIDTAADELLTILTPEHHAQLQHVLHTAILAPQGGLVTACKTYADLVKHLGGPLVDQTTAFLGDLLPQADVADVELSATAGKPEEANRRIAAAVRSASQVAGGPEDEGRTFVMVPDSLRGHEYAALVKKVVPSAVAIPVEQAGQDLLFCRERNWYRPADVWSVIGPCHDAYIRYSKSIDSSPHSRFDITHWLPISSEAPAVR